MRRSLLFIFLFISLLSLDAYCQQSIIKGTVLDNKDKPLSFANISIEGTIDGTNSEDDGSFVLETTSTGVVTLNVTMIGYLGFRQTADISELNNLTIRLKPDAKLLAEVVVSISSFHIKGGTDIEQTNAIDLVTTAGSNGDLYRAMAMFPGTQAAGMDGRLLVRGGNSNESQTYIDDMHVLSPYSSAPENVGARSRYSAFLFEGISFSMGAYSSEYSQGLSSVLPLWTKSKSPISKLGGSVSSVGLGSGGTKAWEGGSTSFNFDYTNIGPYNNLMYPRQKKLWSKPYTTLSGQNQVRFELGKNTYLKTYFAYENTSFEQTVKSDFTDNKRKLGFDEDNLLLNSTFRTKSESGMTFFSGIAFSLNNKRIDGGRVVDDKVSMKESELHLKMKASKRFSNVYRFEIGAESMLRKYDFSYTDTTHIGIGLNHSINGVYVSNDFSLRSNLFLNVSSRLEYTTLNKSLSILPRVALVYDFKGITFSGAYGKYQQLADNDLLIYNKRLESENCQHFIFGINQQIGDKILKIEAYRKKYADLVKIENNLYQSDGKGFSNGIDVFLSDPKFLKNWQYSVAYSYNNSKREYLDFPEMANPYYATKHNAFVSLKYNALKYKTILGISNQFASGRSYHNPNKEGFMNATTPNYNSLDVCVTYLAHKRLIIYASAQNIANRKNVYGYRYAPQKNDSGIYDRVTVTSLHNQFFFIGFFFTLSGKTAYDASNF